MFLWSYIIWGISNMTYLKRSVTGMLFCLKIKSLHSMYPSLITLSLCTIGYADVLTDNRKTTIKIKL